MITRGSVTTVDVLVNKSTDIITSCIDKKNAVEIPLIELQSILAARTAGENHTLYNYGLTDSLCRAGLLTCKELETLVTLQSGVEFKKLYDEYILKRLPKLVQLIQSAEARNDLRILLNAVWKSGTGIVNATNKLLQIPNDSLTYTAYRFLSDNTGRDAIIKMGRQLTHTRHLFDGTTNVGNIPEIFENPPIQLTTLYSSWETHLDNISRLSKNLTRTLDLGGFPVGVVAEETNNSLNRSVPYYTGAYSIMEILFPPDYPKNFYKRVNAASNFNLQLAQVNQRTTRTRVLAKILADIINKEHFTKYLSFISRNSVIPKSLKHINKMLDESVDIFSRDEKARVLVVGFHGLARNAQSLRLLESASMFQLGSLFWLGNLDNFLLTKEAIDDLTVFGTSLYITTYVQLDSGRFFKLVFELVPGKQNATHFMGKVASGAYAKLGSHNMLVFDRSLVSYRSTYESLI